MKFFVRYLALASLATFTFGSLHADTIAIESKVGSVNEKKVQELLRRYQETNSDSLLVMKDGKVILERYSERGAKPIQAFSITKSMVNLAVGFLLEEGKLSSLDVPVHQYFPEWNQGRKKLITIRHLMNHTSGISTDVEDVKYPDSVQLALAAELSTAPGAAFEYNNKAVHLLSGVVQKIAGMRTDLYVNERIFVPLGITNYNWHQDHSGHAGGASGLEIQASDLAKIGQMLLSNGQWNGRQIVNPEWMKLSTRPAQKYEKDCGLLWWIIHSKKHPGYYANGLMGQYMVVIPDTGVVAVRQYQERGNEDDKLDEFDDFPTIISELVD